LIGDGVSQRGGVAFDRTVDTQPDCAPSGTDAPILPGPARRRNLCTGDDQLRELLG
jgi:hypothetical protein